MQLYGSIDTKNVSVTLVFTVVKFRGQLLLLLLVCVCVCVCVCLMTLFTTCTVYFVDINSDP